jgi:predicted GNAT family N-acyltransferase
MGSRVQVRLADTPEEIEAVRALRIRVFVGEQGVPLEAEMDELDSLARHAIALADGVVVGTGRMYGASTGTAHVGRMAVDTGQRRRGIGGLILSFLEDQARLGGAGQVELHAQTYVRSFYERHGYAAVGEPFFEVDIEHVRMTRRLE